jgi:pimeloyl-ACP methyl ester carboxylesterase
VRLRIAVAAVLVLGALAVPTTALPANASSCLSGLPQVRQVTVAGSRPLAGNTPVLFVHGINSGPGIWDPSSTRSISGQVAAMPKITAWTFSYAPDSLQWVTSKPIGPDLASAISCLAAGSGRAVIVVGHSMGGLATQYAIGMPASPAAGHVAGLITIGTPFDGSQILTDFERVIDDGSLAAGDDPDVALAEAILSACAGVADHLDVNLCSYASALRSPVGTALEAHSAAIAALPAWPAGLPVTNTAGDISLSVQIGDLIGRRYDIGDGAVSLSSATAHNTSGAPDIQHCATSLRHVLSLGTNPCFHLSLPSNPAIISAVIDAIRADTTPVLGLVSSDPFQLGFGIAQPTSISLGDGPFGVGPTLHWKSWGGPQATASATDAGIFMGSPADSRIPPGNLGEATVVAFDLGICQGRLVYQALEWYFPQHGQAFNPSTYVNTCTHLLVRQ